MDMNQFKLKASYSDVRESIGNCLSDNKKGYVCAVNANILVHAFESASYCNIVCSSLFNFCDSSNVMFINNLLENRKIQRYPGPNLFKDILLLKKYKSCFLGTTPEVLSGLKERLSEAMDPDIWKMQFYSPPFLPIDEFDYESIAKLINKEQPDIIWVALGAPKQEIFMHRLTPFLDRGIMIGVGAAFNFYSGIETLVRAPSWVRAIYLEWLFRAFQEPRKIVPRQIKSAYYLPQILLSGFFSKFRK